MIRRSQDELVETHADHIMANEESAAALMEYFESQIRSHRRSPRSRLGALCRGILKAFVSVAKVCGPTSGVPTRDPK